MTALLSLEPREAGADAVEPDIDFDASLDELHKRVQCLVSTLCERGTHTDTCMITQ